MKLGDFNSDVTLTWEGGGVTAPVDAWVSQILLSLSKWQQKEILDAVVAEVNRRNEMLKETE